MTSIHRALRQQLNSLHQLLNQLNNEAYGYASRWLSNATIGQHTRHVIELVQCLVNGYETGHVNYDERKRDKQIETDRRYAIAAIEDLLASFNKADKAITLAGCFDDGSKEITTVASTYNRELVYNIEHAVHHMALIKVGLKELDITYADDTFGVAYATVQYRKLCAQ
jgi:hypothetical protein